MKKYYFVTNILFISILFMGMISCVRDNEITIPQTTVMKINPQTLESGDVITITGENINLITGVLFGDIPADNIDPNLGQRNKSELSVTIPVFPETQTVIVTAIYNTIQKAIVCDALEVYVPPVIPEVTSQLPDEALSGSVITLTGNNLNIIKRITINDQEIPIRSKDLNQLTFVLPEFTETTSATVRLVYDNSLGIDQVLVLSTTIQINPIPPVIPTLTSEFPISVKAGEQITLSGTDLDIVKKLLLNSDETLIGTKTTTGISFVAPDVSQVTTFSLSLFYDNSIGVDQSLSVSNAIEITPVSEPSLIYNWKNIQMGGQSTSRSFINASTGSIITPCDLFDVQADVDFMLTVSSSNEFQFYNPANATNILKNQKCGGLALGLTDESGDGKSYATFLSVVTKLRLLSLGNEAQAALINKVNNDQITELSDAVFEGISLPSSSTLKNPVAGDIFWFKNDKKGKNGLAKIISVNPDATTPTNGTIVLDIYYQK